jgi:hypothetical protein
MNYYELRLLSIATGVASDFFFDTESNDEIGNSDIIAVILVRFAQEVIPSMSDADFTSD